MKNSIVKTLIYDQQVRLLFVDNTNLVQEILRLNKEMHMLLKLILGKAVSVVSILSGTLKKNQRLSYKITMSNPKYRVFADADADGNVRGYLSSELLTVPKNDLNRTSIEDLIGFKGTIRVVKGFAMNQFTGITHMPNRDIVDDISHYFIQSEQTPTFIKADIQFDQNDDVLYSNAIFAQLLPGASIHLLDEIKRVLNTNMSNIQSLLNVNAKNLEERLSVWFKVAKVIGYGPVQFHCGCSKEMFYGMLYSLGKDDIRHAISRQEPINTICHICGRAYSFDQNDLQVLL